MAEALARVVACETAWSRDTSPPWGIHTEDPPPYNRLYGPVYPRGGVAALVLQDGRELGSVGDIGRADLTFSVAKTYLALIAGVAHDAGFLPDPDEAVVRRCPGIGFDEGPNRSITWRHLLQQTSEWEGVCMGIPDQVDRWRWLAYQPGKAQGRKGTYRPLQPPGSYFEYNDVRINQLALALLHLIGQPLPAFFRERVLEPCGCSDPFRWDGYTQGVCLVDGVPMLSVPGGSHWGGGVSISARDQARIAQMMLAEGQGPQGGQVISRQWLAAMRKPCAVAPFYGLLLWLNTAPGIFPSASEHAVFALGAGSSLVCIDQSLGLVVVLRWIEAAHTDHCLAQILAALPDRPRQPATL